MLTRENFPKIYWNHEWRHICPYQFTENEHGVNSLCSKFNLVGGSTRKANNEEQNMYMHFEHYDAFLLGACKPNDILTNCDVDCNIDQLGNGCDVREYQSGNQTKVHHVCRNEQNWLYFLYCNGSKDLPLYSCYGKYNIEQYIHKKSILSYCYC